MDDVRVELPKTTVRMYIDKSNRLCTVVTRFKDGLGTVYSGDLSYSQVGNAGTTLYDRVSRALRNTTTASGFYLDVAVANEIVSGVRQAVIRSEGSVFSYLDSFNTATYDEVTDKWTLAE